jgi:hypothetical protein
MTSGQTLVGKRSRSAVDISDDLLGPLNWSRGSREIIQANNAERVTGSAKIRLGLLPPILIFNDPNNPKSVHIFDPEQPEQWLGSGAKFLGAQIAVVDEPLTIGIEKVLPSLRAERDPLTGREDPYYEKSGRHVLWKANFY